MSGRAPFGLGVLAAILLFGCSRERDDLLMQPPGMDSTPRQSTGAVPSGPTVNSNPAPPAIAGGTLFIASDGLTAIVSDPDRDRIVVADLENASVVGSIELEPRDEPGRAAEDSGGRVHVTLRRGGALVTIDPVTATVLGRRAICPAPRGIAYDATTDLLHVACDTGELVSIAPTADTPTRVLRLGRDLRDVIVDGGRLLVSRFRHADLLVVGATGTVERSFSAARVMGSGPLGGFDMPSVDGTVAAFAPAVAWRAVQLPDRRVAMLHQGALETPVQTDVPNGYGGSSLGSFDPCNSSIVKTALTTIDPDGDPNVAPRPRPPIAFAVTAVDMAISRAGDVFVISAGNNWGIPNGQMLRIAIAPPELEPPGCQNAQAIEGLAGESVAVAIDGLDRWVVQSREPSQLQLEDGTIIALGGATRRDTGLALFHMNSGGGIACASCHPEGRDDGRTWEFQPIGPRRTQVPSGGIMATAPFHWTGDMDDFNMLVHEVFSSRMGGGLPDGEQLRSFAHWLDGLPAPKAALAADEAAAERGRTIFERPDVACGSCHAGTLFTNNTTHDVGTGDHFQVPSLVGVSGRPPFMHNGCAATLRDRFDPACGGGDDHGLTSHLSAAEIDDLVAYLETL